MRFNVSQLPVSGPWVFNASNAYSEQLGVKRQDPKGPKRKTFAGEITQRYMRTKKIKIF